MVASNGSSFQPIANPYIVGNPIEDRKLFFGREDDFDYIRRKIVGGKKGGLLVLCGTRRSGKTSILFQIKGGRLGEEYVPVLMDMQSMTVQGDGEFLAKLAFEIIRAIDRQDISYQKDYLAAAATNPFNAFQALIQVIRNKLPDKKIILLFDEYELFETHVEKKRFTTDILHLLANWMEHTWGVFIVFTGSDKLESRPGDCWAHFLGKALHRRISFLSRRDTFRLIEEPVHGRITYEDGVTEEIYHLTAGQPFYTQVLCQSIVDHLNEESRSLVTAEDVERVVAELIDNPLPQMVFSWSSLPDVEKLFLSCMAEMNKDEPGPLALTDIEAFPVEKQSGLRFRSQKLHEAGERLFHADLLTKEASGDHFAFKMDLWRRWVARMHSFWEVVAEVGNGGQLADGILAAELGRRWPRWLGAGLAAIVLVLLGIKFFGGSGDIQPVVQQGGVPAPPDSSWISITTEPANATAHLDDRFLGRTPQRVRRVLAGNRVLRVELGGHHSWSDTLDLIAEDTLQRHYALVEVTGDLDIRSNPSGAKIRLDGRDLGAVTPHTARGLSVTGHHQVSLSLDGYHLETISNIILPGDRVTSVSRELSRIFHSLTIRSRPDSARVFLDGQELGLTPFFSNAVSEGAHSLVVRKERYHEWLQIIEVTRDEILRPELSPLAPGRLVFRIRYYADIWINGQLVDRGVPHYSAEFPPGIYRIELTHPNYDPLIQTIDLKTGTTDTITYQFDENEIQQ